MNIFEMVPDRRQHELRYRHGERAAHVATVSA